MKDHLKNCKCPEQMFHKIDVMVNKMNREELTQCLMLTVISLSIHANDWHFDYEKKLIKESKFCDSGEGVSNFMDAYLYTKASQRLMSLAADKAKKDQSK